ncbi:DUF5348 domain-containing protein [Bacillus sp. OV166]|uniref:DUF5348 domain-containing protein n=1 Tax=Bacillus sp. OV166 TaxID=1882763 RepID=UPI00358F0B95
MRYNKDLGYWLVLKAENGYMMHCVEPFALCIGGDRDVSCVLELGRQWYVVISSKGVYPSL